MSGGQNAPDSALPDPTSQVQHFPLDPAVTPARVVGSETDDQVTDLPADRRPAGLVRKSPVLGDEPAMPAQEGSRSNQTVTVQVLR